MATGNKAEPTLETVAVLLGLSADEVSTILNAEYRIIKSDVMEKRRYPQQPAEFIKFALERIAGIAFDQKNEKYLAVLKRIIHRDEPRKLYFFNGDLEAISRILFFIDHGDQTEVALDNLELHSLPFLLRRTRNLQTLNISKNRIHNLSILSTLRDLRVLIADNNLITDIGPLKDAKKLQVISLNNNFVKTNYQIFKELPSLKEVQLAGNRINNELVKEILECPYIQKITLEDNPIDAPEKYLTDIVSLRSFLNIEIPSESNGSKRPATTETLSQVVSESEVIYEHKRSSKINDSAPEPEANEPPPASTAADLPKEEVFVSYAIRDIRLRGNPDKNLLDIEKLSGIFYNLIANSDSNGEHFFGLFGRWGRGKTFFWKYILKNNLDQKKYIPIEFHAWKYQDTPGIWAYLYNTLNDAYLGAKPKWYQFTKWLTWYWKLINLNEQRGRLLSLIVFIISLAASVAIFIYNDVFDGNDAVKIGLGIGIPVWLVSILTYIVKTFKPDARKIISSLTTNVNFKSQLGFQHEIQQELKYLLKTWIPEKQKFNKRIFLFIDDIDRCSEDKIIQIVDYIRVLLHDKEIQDRVTVLAAIDERILLHAIQNKYEQFIENKENDATHKELCREYMDKLFLAGLKLGPLTEYEKRQIVEGFTGMDTSKSETPEVQSEMDSNIIADIINESNTTRKDIHGTVSENNPPDALTNVLAGTVSPYLNTPKTTIPITPTPIDSTAYEQFPYEKWEQEFIKDILARNTESTPRSIRVYTYRYLLGKQLVEKALTEGKASWKQWYNTKEAKQCFATKLLYYGFSSDTDHLLADYKRFIKDYDENRSVNVNISEYEVPLNQELGSIMFQVLTMIIAY